jgi:hypothetical protein
MKIKMPSGVILECDNDSVNESRLLAGGVELSEKAQKPATPKKETKSAKAKADEE